MRQLAPGDAFMLYTESPGAPNHIGSLGIYDPATAPGGRLTFEALREYYEGRIHLAQAFRQRLVRAPFDLTDPWWVQDSSFDLEYHLRHSSLPRPGNWRQLCNLVSRLHAQTLDLTRPPWEAYLIDGLDSVPGAPEGSVAIMHRIHHSAIDGVGGVEVLSALFQTSPDEGPPEHDDRWRPERVPNAWELLGRATLANAARPWRVVRGVSRALPHVVRLPRRVAEGDVRLPALAVPTTPFNARVSPHRVFDARVFRLADLKAIKAAVTGATINDVVLTVCGGAMRAYLDKRGELPEASMAAAVPVSVRTEGEADSEGNRVSQLFCDLHTDVADPRRRLADVAATTREAKGSQPALGGNQLTQMSSVLPGALFGLALRANAEIARRGRSAGLLNTQVSNIPGPPIPLYCAGARMLRMYGLGPVITGAALIHVIMSYCDEVTFSFTSDREVVPDPAAYADCLQDAFDELHAATTA